MNKYRDQTRYAQDFLVLYIIPSTLNIQTDMPGQTCYIQIEQCDTIPSVPLRGLSLSSKRVVR